MAIANEIEALKRECLTGKGKPKKDCDLEKLRKLVELEASRELQIPPVEKANNDEKKLLAQYEDLVSRLFEKDPVTGDNRLRKGTNAMMLADFYELRDKLRQPEPESGRLSLSVTSDGMIEAVIEKGPPVELQGQTDTGQWKTVAQIMSSGGRIKISAGKYSAFRLARGTNQPEYHEPPKSSPVPKNRLKKENIKQFDTAL